MAILPSAGQLAGGSLPGRLLHPASGVVSEYSFTRSTDTMFVSSLLIWRTAKFRTKVI